jgi:hypothetical protein
MGSGEVEPWRQATGAGEGQAPGTEAASVAVALPTVHSTSLLPVLRDGH